MARKASNNNFKSSIGSCYGVPRFCGCAERHQKGKYMSRISHDISTLIYVFGESLAKIGELDVDAQPYYLQLVTRWFWYI